MSNRTPIETIEATRNALAFLLVMAFIVAMGALFIFTIPEKNESILTYMVGQLSGMALTALGFYFINKVGQDALDAKRTENTGKALEAITATAHASGANDAAAQSASETAEAARDKADEYADPAKPIKDAP